MRIVRARADEWGIDPYNVGVCGFSAGGHLCATLCMNFGVDAYESIDDIDHQSCRPDFALLVYPAYLTEPRESNDVDPLVKHLKRNVTPPMFMAIARNDPFARGVLNFYLGVRDARIPAECHVYATGGHGGGMDPIFYPTSEWPKACLRWMDDIEPELDRLKQKASSQRVRE